MAHAFTENTRGAISYTPVITRTIKPLTAINGFQLKSIIENSSTFKHKLLTSDTDTREKSIGLRPHVIFPHSKLVLK